MLDAILAEPPCCLKCQPPLTGHQGLHIPGCESRRACDACHAKRKYSHAWDTPIDGGHVQKQCIGEPASAAHRHYAGYDDERAQIERGA